MLNEGHDAKTYLDVYFVVTNKVLCTQRRAGELFLYCVLSLVINNLCSLEMFFLNITGLSEHF